MENHDKILARVRKMLKLANDKGATEGERDNAMRMAHATLAKYNLDLAAVEESGKKAAGEDRTQTSVQFYGRPWARSVCVSVGNLFFCRYIFITAKKATDVRHYFVGRKSNAVTSAEMAKFIVQSIQREAKRRARREGQGNPWVRSFCWGAAAVIHTRVEEILKASERQKAVGSTGKSLVLASLYQREKEANEVYVQEQWGELKTGQRGKGIADRDAMGQGADYGARVSLNRQLEGRPYSGPLTKNFPGGGK